MDTLLRFSAVAGRMRPSPIRELFALTQRPGMISFAGGLPDPEGFPVEAFADCAGVLERDGRTVLQYGASEGYGPLREILLGRMAEHLGYPVRAEELIVTSGSQQGVDLVARVLLDPGDVVVVEAPTYPGTVHALRNTGARFATVPCDADGLQVELLAEVVARCQEQTGRRPKLLYTIPDFANPTGACLSLERRHRLLEIAEKLELPILEDDPYGRLRYRGDALPTLKKLAGDSDLVSYASSFSKVLAPGVRVAWTIGAPRLIRAMVLVRQGEDLCTSTVTQALVAEYCRRGLLESHLASMLELYERKYRALRDGLVRHLPAGAAEWTPPDGGFFFWLRIPGRDASELFRRAVEEGVAFVPGVAFYPGADEQVGAISEGPDLARLCFTFADPATIEEGCRRLARAIEGR